ncbi:hypothetical protein BC835DRAFT_52957 [Cytidiella melzeri]|nr:hypothetical protein BC835DRAFT_52957 [Cytidiella melzeri]
MASFTILDRLKPPRSEAVARVRTNGVGLFVVLIATNLLPLPGPYEAIRLVWQSYNYRFKGREAVTVWWVLCLAEIVVLATLTFNVLQATYALRFPPPALPQPTPSTPRPKPMGGAVKSPDGSAGLNQSQRKLIASTPTSAPQPQKSFSSSFYASSPASSPSRMLNYSTVSGAGGADTSFGSSFASSLPGSPSPMGGALNTSLLGMSMNGSSSLASYRGKHRSGAGRAVDGDILQRLTRSTMDDDD